MHKLPDIIRTTRPLNVVIAAVSSLVGSWFVTGSFSDFSALFASLSIALNCAGGNIFNDYFDLETDRINKPDRPFAAGRLSDRDMILSGVIAAIGSIVFAGLISVHCLIFAILIAMLLTLYNTFAKRTVLLGNLLVSFLTSTAFLFGGMAAGNVWGAAVPAVFAFLYHFGREILKDIEDFEGDREVGIITFPISAGIKAAERLAVSVFALLIVLTLAPFLFMEYSIWYLIVALFGVDLLTVFLLMSYFKDKNPEKLSKTNSMLKFGMIFGLLALLLK